MNLTNTFILRNDNCLKGKASTFGPVILFVIAQILLGGGGSPLFTLGTTYVDDHVRKESSSMYIGKLVKTDLLSELYCV